MTVRSCDECAHCLAEDAARALDEAYAEMQDEEDRAYDAWVDLGGEA